MAGDLMIRTIHAADFSPPTWTAGALGMDVAPSRHLHNAKGANEHRVLEGWSAGSSEGPRAWKGSGPQSLSSVADTKIFSPTPGSLRDPSFHVTPRKA